MKKKLIIVICFLLVIVLLVPIPMRMRDGGTVKYQAVLYSVSDIHRLVSTGDEVTLETGIIIEILGLEVFNNIATATEKLSSGESTTPNEGNLSDVITGGTSTNEIFDIAVSYANWGEFGKIHTKPLNISKMAISSVIHLPIYKFDTLSELEQFKTDVDGILSIDQSYDEIPSFNDVTIKYDEDFFAENTLMLVYVEAGSGSCRYGVDSISHTDGNFCIHIKQTNNPEIHTDDMAGWFITVAVPDNMVADCTSFDADFNNDLK